MGVKGIGFGLFSQAELLHQITSSRIDVSHPVRELVS